MLKFIKIASKLYLKIRTRSEKPYENNKIWEKILLKHRKINDGAPIVDRNKNKSIQGKFEGKRCFIIGSSPSINEIKIEKIDNDFIFLLNKTYLLANKFGKKPDALVMSDPLAYLDYGHEIDFAQFKYVFLSTDINPALQEDNIYRYEYYKYPMIYDGFYARTITEPIYHAHTVALMACQIAIALGFIEIIFVGVDLSFSTEQGHFYESGEREKIWTRKVSAKKSMKMLAGFKYLATAAGRDGIRILNASAKPGLRGVEKISFDQLF